ncbi:MAG: hypothetical protein OEY08_10160 [Gammaproteobacteria bacterium]|nr:hypothetical protein [Gammaproteobacteria bacterium]
MLTRYSVAVVVGLLAAVTAHADDDGNEGCRVTGSWLLKVEFSSGLRFQQLLSFHRGGTVSETNSGLHAASFPDPNDPPPDPSDPTARPPFNGSDGHGAWRKMPGCKVQWSFLKFVYAGPDLSFPDLPPFEAGAPVGFLRVQSTATIVGDALYTIDDSTVTD